MALREEHGCREGGQKTTPAEPDPKPADPAEQELEAE